MTLPSESEIADRIRRRSHWEFRGLVSDIWEREGWETWQYQDSPAHVLASRKGPDDRERKAIQCHCLSRGNKVTRSDIEDYAALPAKADVDTVTVITTTGYTDSALDAGDIPYMTLMDINHLFALLKVNDGSDLLDKHAPPSTLRRLVKILMP